MLGRLMQRLRVPGVVRPFEYNDPDRGERISLRTSTRYSILTIGSKELYFERTSGRFDGTGAMALDDAAALTRLQADCIRRSAASRASDARLRRH